MTAAARPAAVISSTRVFFSDSRPKQPQVACAFHRMPHGTHRTCMSCVGGDVECSPAPQCVQIALRLLHAVQQVSRCWRRHSVRHANDRVLCQPRQSVVRSQQQ